MPIQRVVQLNKLRIDYGRVGLPLEQTPVQKHFRRSQAGLPCALIVVHSRANRQGDHRNQGFHER